PGVRPRVIAPIPFELPKVGDCQTLILGACGNDDRPSGYLTLVDERNNVESILDTQACNFTGADQPCSQPLSLDRRSGRQVTPRDAIRESGIVLDARAGTGLTARTNGVKRDGVKTFRGPVHRGGEARWPHADHNKIKGSAGDGMVGKSHLVGKL